MIGSKSNEVGAIARVIWKTCKRHVTQTWRQWYLSRLLGRHESWKKSLRISKQNRQKASQRIRESKWSCLLMEAWSKMVIFKGFQAASYRESMWFEVDNTETWGWSSMLGPVQIIHYAKAFGYYPQVKTSAE